MDSTTTAAILTAEHGGTAITFTTPIKLLFLSAVRSTDTGSDTEWSTSGGYTAGTGFSGLTFAASVAGAPSSQASNIAATITNAPAGTWAGCIEVDSSGTPKKLHYGTLTGGNKTVNSGDTCTVPSGSLSDTIG
jgi:hypothetical protein